MIRIKNLISQKIILSVSSELSQITTRFLFNFKNLDECITFKHEYSLVDVLTEYSI